MIDPRGVVMMMMMMMVIGSLRRIIYASLSFDDDDYYYFCSSKKKGNRPSSRMLMRWVLWIRERKVGKRTMDKEFMWNYAREFSHVLMLKSKHKQNHSVEVGLVYPPTKTKMAMCLSLKIYYY